MISLTETPPLINPTIIDWTAPRFLSETVISTEILPEIFKGISPVLQIFTYFLMHFFNSCLRWISTGLFQVLLKEVFYKFLLGSFRYSSIDSLKSTSYDVYGEYTEAFLQKKNLQGYFHKFPAGILSEIYLRSYFYL